MDREARLQPCSQFHSVKQGTRREVQIQEEQCGFCPGCGQWTNSLPLWRREKAYSRVPQGILWGVLKKYRYQGHRLTRRVASQLDMSRTPHTGILDMSNRHPGGHFNKLVTEPPHLSSSKVKVQEYAVEFYVPMSPAAHDRS
ncbi:hypothetical protein L3Q82_019240 [Scortum barcoo]|uniref:Uncharacterized protein n=1 Tax=Scortum barcoo TaxID=214431 RepID=A0ACB8VC78_9TELE|nr:hypothetical protein L3Q82_019240 [Scortum barcoo]